ncbi:tyrosine-type recombinase/integrase, partial [Klebsiella pneumoniae]|uniref:tyrosine-type recombinase/integrase n=1 Tax=Klebsiella pneumoniae TaxID=573 RepID=UPI003F627D0A
WCYDRHRSVRLVVLVGLAIDQIAQSGLSSLSVIYYSAQLFRWAELDLDAKLWTIPAERMKAKREHIVPLSPQAIEILEVMKPISAHREYVFPSRNDPKMPMNSQTANAALKRIGYSGKLVAHGLRSIASTAMNEAGLNADVIEAALAHTYKNEVRKAYNRSIYLDARIELMNWWGQAVHQQYK